MTQDAAPPLPKRWAARTARRGETRRRITDAAQGLFLERGYLATTMGEIAAQAGVAVQTLYLAMGSKVQILSSVMDRAVAGDDDPVPLLERGWIGELEGEQDGLKVLERLVHEGAQIVARAVPIYGRIQEAAADPEVGELLATARNQRYEVVQKAVSIVAHKEGFTRSLTSRAAADVFYSVLSEELYRLFCIDRGWPPRRWERWVADTLKATYFPELPSSPG